MGAGVRYDQVQQLQESPGGRVAVQCPNGVCGAAVHCTGDEVSCDDRADLKLEYLLAIPLSGVVAVLLAMYYSCRYMHRSGDVSALLESPVAGDHLTQAEFQTAQLGETSGGSDVNGSVVIDLEGSMDSDLDEGCKLGEKVERPYLGATIPEDKNAILNL